MPRVDGQAFLADLKALEAEFTHQVEAAVARAVSETRAHAQRTSLFNDRTGVLRSAIHGWSSGTEGEVQALAKYAKFVNGGTVEHQITGNPFLRFEWKGVWVSFRWVTHPGTEPRPFMDEAADWGELVLRQNSEVYVWDAINKFNAK